MQVSKTFTPKNSTEFELCAKLMLSGDHDSDTDGWVVVVSCASLPTWEREGVEESRQDAGEEGEEHCSRGWPSTDCISRTDSHKISLFLGGPSLSIPRLIAFFHCPIPSDVGIFPLCHFAEGMEDIQFDGVSERRGRGDGIVLISFAPPPRSRSRFGRRDLWVHAEVTSAETLQIYVRYNLRQPRRWLQ